MRHSTTRKGRGRARRRQGHGRRARKWDLQYLRAVEGTLSEWTGPVDEEAYRDLWALRRPPLKARRGCVRRSHGDLAARAAVRCPVPQRRLPAHRRRASTGIPGCCSGDRAAAKLTHPPAW